LSGVRRMLIVAAILVALVLPFFLLRTGAKRREVVFSALGFCAAALPIAVLFGFGTGGLGGGTEAEHHWRRLNGSVLPVLDHVHFAFRRAGFPRPPSVPSRPIVVLCSSWGLHWRVIGSDDYS
jgi:hypothetical protein